MRQVPREGRHVSEAHLWAVLDLLPFAVVLVDPEQRVRGVNARAQALLREGDAVRFDGARVRAANAAHDAQLQAAVGAHTSAVLRMPRLSGRRAAEVSIVPLGAQCAAIVISDPGRCVAPNIDRLRELYGLTRAESRVLGAVVQGEGGPRTAEDLGMSVNTLRRHLKSIFAKLHVERQSELVRVVSLGVASLNLDQLSDSHTPPR